MTGHLPTPTGGSSTPRPAPAFYAHRDQLAWLARGWRRMPARHLMVNERSAGPTVSCAVSRRSERHPGGSAQAPRRQDGVRTASA